MPKSETPRSKDSARSKTNRRMLDIINQAQSLDRRRQAQIANQVGTINRLLARFDEHQCFPGVDIHAMRVPPSSSAAYTEEMRVLHEAGAELVAREEAVRLAARDLLMAIDVLHLDQLTVVEGTDVRPYQDALRQLQTLVGFSSSVSESGSDEG